MKQTNHLTLDRLAPDFIKLGLTRGDCVLVHGSLSSLGYMEGGALTVVEALLAAIGPYGTIVGPTLTGSEALSSENPPTLDIASTPGWTGAIPEAIRTYPGAIRSYHPTHSVSAIGPLADWLCAEHHRSGTPCGWLSPYVRLAMRGGKILMLGVRLDTCTLFHSAEELSGVPYICQSEIAPGVVILPHGERLEVPTRLHRYDGPARDYPAFEPIFQQLGVLKIGEVGAARSLLLDAKRALDIVTAFLARDPYAVTCERRRPLEAAFLDRPGPRRLWIAPETMTEETENVDESCGCDT